MKRVKITPVFVLILTKKGLNRAIRYTFAKKEEFAIFDLVIHIIHILAVLIYGGFLFVDIFFLSKMPLTLNGAEYAKAREAFMIHVRKVVPWALLVAVATGLYMISRVFGPVSSEGLSFFQATLSLKAFLGLWLGLRGFNQKFFKINPFLFKGHLFPFASVIFIVILSQVMYFG